MKSTEFVSLETMQLLGDLYDGDYDYHWYKQQYYDGKYKENRHRWIIDLKEPKVFMPAPLRQQMIDWLEKQGIFIERFLERRLGRKGKEYYYGIITKEQVYTFDDEQSAIRKACEILQEQSIGRIIWNANG